MADDEETKCDCEYGGYFHSGVPGILACVEGGKYKGPANNVQRCDLCCRYESDEAAYKELVRRGMAEPLQIQKEFSWD